MQLYTDKEYSVIKNTFDEKTLISFRKYFLDQPLDEVEKALVVMTPEVQSVFVKLLNLEFNADIELQQIINPYSGIDYEKDASKITEQLLARKLTLKFLNSKVNGKKGIKLDSLIVDEKISDRENAINNQARQAIVDAVQLAVNKLKFIAEQEDETWEGLQERLRKDSSK
jgi:hypothetical protein